MSNNLAKVKIRRKRVNLTLIGEPADFLVELKERGICRTTPQAITMALEALREKLLERAIKEAQLKRSEEKG
jgi:hypothetical protein